MENAFASCRLYMYIWILGAFLRPGDLLLIPLGDFGPIPIGVAKGQERTMAFPRCPKYILTKNAPNFYTSAQNPVREAYSVHSGVRSAPSNRNSWLCLFGPQIACALPTCKP